MSRVCVCVRQRVREQKRDSLHCNESQISVFGLDLPQLFLALSNKGSRWDTETQELCDHQCFHTYSKGTEPNICGLTKQGFSVDQLIRLATALMYCDLSVIGACYKIR